MTADERIEALLNRAGQTISDLPESYSEEQRLSPQMFSEIVNRFNSFNGFVLHLTDVIDRLETALENTLNERDFLLEMFLFVEPGSRCDICEYGYSDPNSEPCNICMNTDNDDPEPCFVFGGVPEDWEANA